MITKIDISLKVAEKIRLICALLSTQLRPVLSAFDIIDEPEVFWKWHFFGQWLMSLIQILMSPLMSSTCNVENLLM